MPDTRLFMFGLLTMLLVLTSLSYLPSLSGGWLGDDFALVVDSKCAREVEWGRLARLDAGACNYRPIRYLSYALDYKIWGQNPLGFRISNLFYHLLAVLLAFGLSRAVGLSTRSAFIVALLFGVHPVQADTVAYVSGRRDVLCGLGFLGCVLAAGQALTPGLAARRRAGWTALALAAAALSLGSKEMGVTLAAIVPLYAVLVIRAAGVHKVPSSTSRVAIGRSELAVAAGLLVLVASSAGFVVIHRGFVNPISTVADQLFGGSLGTHVATVLGVHWRYAEMLLFPIRLAGDYSPPAIPIADSVFEPMALAGFVWLASLGGAAVAATRRGWSVEAFGLAWYLITMLPVSHIIPHHELAAEHYLYIPVVGLLLTVVALASRLTLDERHWRVVQALAIVICVVAIARTGIRSLDYRGEVAHASATVRHYPESVRGNARLAVRFLADERIDDARPHIEAVLATEFQGSARLDTLQALGLYFHRNDEHELAVRPLREYVAMRPGDLRTLEALAASLTRLERTDEAHSFHLRLIALAPDTLRFHYMAALSAMTLGRTDEAERHVIAALERDDNDLDALLLAANITGLRDRHTALTYLTRAGRLLAAMESPDAQHVLIHRKLVDALSSNEE